jgi:hypothetical protein
MKRYDMRWTTRCGETFEELTPDPTGEWVRYEDVQAFIQTLGVDLVEALQVDMADNLQEGKES